MEGVKLIQHFHEAFGELLYVAFSGGKDSCVILDMVLSVDPSVLVVHNPKVDTDRKTVHFLYEVAQKQSVVYVPFSEMRKFVKQKGLLCQVDGSRRAEATRASKANDFVRDGQSVNREEMEAVNNQGMFGIRHIYPILSWTDEDVFRYIIDHQLPLSLEYGSGV